MPNKRLFNLLSVLGLTMTIWVAGLLYLLLMGSYVIRRFPHSEIAQMYGSLQEVQRTLLILVTALHSWHGLVWFGLVYTLFVRWFCKTWNAHLPRNALYVLMAGLVLAALFTIMQTWLYHGEMRFDGGIFISLLFALILSVGVMYVYPTHLYAEGFPLGGWSCVLW